MPSIRFTDQAIDKLPASTGETIFWSDERDRRLQLLIGKKKRSWSSVMMLNGRSKRQAHGEWPHVNTQAALRAHSVFVGQMSRGIIPVASGASDGDVGNLAMWLRRYIDGKLQSGKLRAATAEQYRYFIETHAASLLKRDLTSISKTDMEALHRELTSKARKIPGADVRQRKGGKDWKKKTYEPSKATANLVLRIMRAIYRYAAKRHDDLRDPTTIIDFHVIERRTSDAVRLPDWYAHVSALPNIFHRAFLIMCVSTGLRRSNLQELRWADVDLAAGTIFIQRTKAGRSITLPIASQIVDLLRSLPRLNKWVFFSHVSKSGHIVEPRSDVPGSIHDLRREFATACTAVGIPYAHQKLLLDHTIPDITGQYIQESKVDLRVSAQCVVDYLFKQMLSGNVVRLNAA